MVDEKTDKKADERNTEKQSEGENNKPEIKGKRLRTGTRGGGTGGDPSCPFSTWSTYND